MKGEHFTERDWDQELKDGIQNDQRIIEQFLTYLTTAEQDQEGKQISVADWQELLSQWTAERFQQERLKKIVENFLKRKRPTAQISDTMSVRDLLKQIRLELVSIKTDVSQPNEEINESLEGERMIEDVYLNIVRQLGGYDPSQKQIKLTVHQLDVFHEELISRSSQEKARLERTRVRNRRLDTTLKDMDQVESDTTRSNKTDETNKFADVAHLLKTKGRSDIWKTEKRGSGIAQFIKQAELLVFNGRTFVFPKEEFYTFSAEDQKRFINAFEKDSSFVVMEDVGRATYASEPVKNFIDILLKDNTYTEDELMQLLIKLDKKHGLTQLASEYQKNVLQKERFSDCDLVNPRLFQVYYDEIVKELEGVFTQEQIRQRLEHIRLQQICARLVDFRFENDEADKVIAQGIEFVSSGHVSDQIGPVKKSKHFELVLITPGPKKEKRKKTAVPLGPDRVLRSDQSVIHAFGGGFHFKSGEKTIRVDRDQIFLINGVEYTVFGLVQDPESADHNQVVASRRFFNNSYEVFSLEELDKGLVQQNSSVPEKYPLKESIQTASEDFIKKYDDPTNPLFSFVVQIAETVRRTQFYETKNVPLEVLFESVRCALLTRIGSQLVRRTTQLGERDIQARTTSIVNLVNSFFVHPIEQGENHMRFELFVEITRRNKKLTSKYYHLPAASQKIQQSVNSFFGRLQSFTESITGSGFEDLEKLAQLYVALIQVRPNITISEFGVSEPDKNASEDTTNALQGTIWVV